MLEEGRRPFGPLLGSGSASPSARTARGPLTLPSPLGTQELLEQPPARKPSKASRSAPVPWSRRARGAPTHSVKEQRSGRKRELQKDFAGAGFGFGSREWVVGNQLCLVKVCLGERRQKRHLRELGVEQDPGRFFVWGFCVCVCIAVLFCLVCGGRACGIELGALCDSLGPGANLDGGG